MEQVESIRIVSLLLTFICAVGTSSAYAKSVYAITDHDNSTIKVYDIQEDELEYQAEAEVDEYGDVVSVTINSQLGLMFITYEIGYEGSPKVVWVNAKTLEEKGFIDLGGAPCYASEFAGIVENEGKGLDLMNSYCYNKVILLSGKMLVI